jgi:hypothetical protein
MPSTEVVAHCENSTTKIQDLSLIFHADKKQTLEQVKLYFGLSNATTPSALVALWDNSTALTAAQSTSQSYVLSLPVAGFREGAKFKHYATYKNKGDTEVHDTEDTDVTSWSRPIRCDQHHSHWMAKKFILTCMGLAAIAGFLLTVLLLCATRHRRHRRPVTRCAEDEQYERVYNRAEEEDEFTVDAERYKPAEHVKMATRRAADVRRDRAKKSRSPFSSVNLKDAGDSEPADDVIV